MEPLDEAPRRPEVTIPLGSYELDIRLYPTHRQLGLGIAFSLDGPHYQQVFGISIHLLLIYLQFEVFKHG